MSYLLFPDSIDLSSPSLCGHDFGDVTRSLVFPEKVRMKPPLLWIESKVEKVYISHTSRGDSWVNSINSIVHLFIRQK